MFSRYQKGYSHMTYAVTQRILSSEDIIYDYCDDFCRKAKLLYNAALFRVRNTFTGYEKEHRTSNEDKVFDEIAALQSALLLQIHSLSNHFLSNPFRYDRVQKKSILTFIQN